MKFGTNNNFEKGENHRRENILVIIGWMCFSAIFTKFGSLTDIGLRKVILTSDLQHNPF